MLVPKNQKALTIVVLLGLHLAITLPLAYWVNIWADEASSLYTTNYGLIAAVNSAISNERQAPLYFAILAIWRRADTSIFFARLLSIIFSSAAIILFGNLAFRKFTKWTATIVTCFAALHPFLIWASTEIRVYSLVILLSIVLIAAFERAFPAENTNPKPFFYAWEVFFAAAATFSIYTNYYLGFGLIGFFCVLLLRRDWKDLQRYFVLMLGVGILALPLIYIVISQVAANTGGFQQDRPMFDGIRFIWHHLLTFWLPAEIFPDENSSLAAGIRLQIARLILLAIGATALLRWRRISMRTYSYAVLTAVIGGLFFASYLLVGENYVAIRHAAVLFIPLILFSASVLSETLTPGMSRPFLKYLLAAAGAVVIIPFFAYSIYTLYPNMKKRGDWKEVASYIQAHTSGSDPILVFTTYDALALKEYYKGPGPVLPNDGFFDFELEDKFGSPASMTRRIQFAISAIPENSERLWLVESEKCITTDACLPLENYVQANYTVTEYKDFYRERVRLLTRKPQ